MIIHFKSPREFAVTIKTINILEQAHEYKSCDLS